MRLSTTRDRSSGYRRSSRTSRSHDVSSDSQFSLLSGVLQDHGRDNRRREKHQYYSYMCAENPSKQAQHTGRMSGHDKVHATHLVSNSATCRPH